MAIEDWSSIGSPVKAEDWSSVGAPPGTEKPSGVLRRAADYGISALKGAISVPETAVGIADIVTGGQAGKAAEDLGFRPKEAKEILSGMMSPEQQAANRAVSEAKGFVPTIVEAVKHPSTIAHTVVESAPSALAGGVVGRAVKAAAPKVAPYLAGAIGEGVVGAGSAAEHVRQQTETGTLDARHIAPVLASGAGTALFGALGGKLSQKFNVTDIDTLVAQGVTREVASEAVKQGMVRRIALGGISEGVFEELPQSVQEQVWQNAALGKPLTEAVPESAAMGMLAGGVMGGGVAALAPGAQATPVPSTQAAPLPTSEMPPTETPEQAFLREQAGVKARWAEQEKARVWKELSAKRQAEIDLQMSVPPVPAVEAPVPHPDAASGSLSSAANVAARGSFKQVSELADFAAEERAAKTVVMEDLLNRQAMRRESELESVGGRVAGAQEQAARMKRLQLLDAIYADESAKRPGMAFLSALEQEFPNAPMPTPEEKQMIAKRESARRAFREQKRVPSTPDESGGMGVREWVAPTPVVRVSEPLAKAQRLLANPANRMSAKGDAIVVRKTGKRLMLVTEEIKNAIQEPSAASMGAHGGRDEIARVETGGGIRQGEQGIETAGEAGRAAASEDQRLIPVSKRVEPDRRPIREAKPARPKRAVDPSRHTLLQAIALEGVDASDPLANDLRVSLGIDPNKNIRVPVSGGPPVWLFRKDGKRIDTIAGNLSQGSSAYLSSHDRQELFEKLYDNPEYLTPQGIEAKARREFEERHAEEQSSQIEKSEAAGLSRSPADESTDAELEWILNNGRIMTEEEADAFNSEFMGAKDVDAAATQAIAWNETGGIETGGPDGTQTQADYNLEAQTEESLAAAEQEKARSAVVATKAAEREEIGRKAEAEPLLLTGSDRHADANPNQGDIFSVKPAVAAQSDGRLAVTGLPAGTVRAVRDMMGIKGAVIGANGNAIFPKGTDARALRAALGITEAAKPIKSAAAPAAERALSVGPKAKGGALNAEPVFVRGGVVHIGEDPATNLDGEDITVPVNATNADIRKALEEGGALTTAQRVYGGEPAVKSKAAAAVNPHTAASLRIALTAAQREIKPLLDNGTVRIISVTEAERILGEPVTTRDMAFFNPEDGTTYFIAGHIDQSAPLRGLIKHEIAVHAYQLGRNSAEFKDILRQVDAMKGSEIDAARARVPTDTDPAHRSEETLAYLVENHPTLGIVKRVIAWFRNTLRAIGWNVPLSVTDVLYMAEYAMTVGKVASRAGSALRSVVRADGYNIIRDPNRQQAANLIARSEAGDLRGIRDPEDGSLYVWDAYKATHQDAAEVLGIDYAKAERLIFSAKELADLPPGVFSDEPGYRVTRTALPEPTVGEAKMTHEEFRKAFFSRAAPKHYGELSQRQLRAWANVVGKPQTALERAKEFHKNWRKSLEQGVFDQYAPIKEISQEGYIKARMTKGGDSTLEAVFLYGKPVLDANGAIKVQFDKANKGLNGFASVLAKLDGEHDRFLLWVAAQRAEALKTLGLENLFEQEDIEALKTLNEGTMRNGASREAAYAVALKEMMAYNNAVLDIAYQRGLISDATRVMYRETPYVPFYRLADENVVQGFTAQAGMVNQQAWKKLTGGTGRLNEDLLANMLQNWSHLVTASARNDAAKVTLEDAVRLGAAEEVPSGSPVKGAVVFRENSNTVMKNGVRVANPELAVRNHERAFVVSDPHLLEAISALGNVVRVPKVLRLFKHYLTLGVTVNPTYKIRNLMRDSIQSMALADVSLNPAKNIKAGWKLTAEDSETRAQMLASGAIIRMGSMLDGQNADMGRELVEKMGVPRDHILDDANKVKKFWKHTVRPAFDAYQEFGDRGEQVNRAALYDRLIQKGMSHGEAAFWARDLMDFSMSGSWPAIRFLTQTVPFMNARLQGLYKLGRSAKADRQRFATVIAGVTLASLALLAAYHDDDDWKKREDWDRDNYWWFKVGGKAFYVPKPFEIGAIGTIAERLAEYMTDDEMTGERFGKGLFNLVNNQLSMNPTPQAIKPLIDLWANKDSFTGKPIETMGMERLKPEDRYRQSTSGVARVLSQLGMPNPTQLVMGEYQQMSPVQIDHLIRAYFSWIGTAATTTLDYGILRPVMDKTERPSMQLQDVFLVGNFVKDLPSGSSRYVTQMYEQAKEIEQAYNSYRSALKASDAERAAELMESEGEKIKQYRKIETIKRAESKWSERARIIERSALSPEEKREALTRIAHERDILARRVSP